MKTWYQNIIFAVAVMGAIMAGIAIERLIA